MENPRRLGPLDSPPRRRVARSFRTVALGGVALGALIVAVGVSLYLRYVHYERVAAHHVPPGSVLALRLDVEQVALYEPVRRHLIPLLGGPGRAAADAMATLGRVEERTGLKRGDLRELVVARGETRADWVIVLGGIFPHGTSPGVLAAALAAEDPAWVPSMDGTVVVHSGLRVAVGRAADGAVLVASSQALLVAAREQSTTYEQLDLAPVGAGGVAMRKAGVQELRSWPSLLADEGLSGSFSGVAAVRGKVILTDRTAVTLTLTDQEPGASTATIQKALAIAKGFDRSTATPGELLMREGAERAVSAAPAAGSATVTLTWERAEVDQAFELLAEAIQDHWR
jgi:hypothetical protein